MQLAAGFTWLAEGEAAHLMAAGERRDPLLLLDLGTKLQDRTQVERLMHKSIRVVIRD